MLTQSQIKEQMHDVKAKMPRAMPSSREQDTIEMQRLGDENTQGQDQHSDQS
jgi:hypothetical protein